MNALRLTTLFPFVSWLPMLDRETLRADLIAGVVAGVLILPQAIALATLAGMPPEYGFYTSIFPVIIASLYGSSWHALSGPNTAMCIMIGSVLGFYAGLGTEDYITYAITLSFMVGAIQLVFGVLRLGVIFSYFSHAAMVAIITGVGVVIIVQQVGNFLGQVANIPEPIKDTFFQVFYLLPGANWHAVLVGTVTVVSGLLVKRYLKGWPHLIICVLAGMIAAWGLELFLGPATVGLYKLGTMTLSPLPFSAPDFSPENFAEAAEALYTAAFVLAFLGLMQSCVIARAMAIKSGQKVDMNQEVIGQSLSNLGGSFLSCFPSCGSFNRSASNIETGGRTPLVGVISAIVLGALVFLATPIVAELPIAVMAGALFLVGAGLIKTKDIWKLVRIHGESRIIFMLCLVATVYGGLDKGVILGILASIVAYLRSVSRPEIDLFFGEDAEQYVPANLMGPATVLQVSGSVFFGSLQVLERALTDLAKSDGRRGHLVIVAEHLHSLDVAGAEALLQEAGRREAGGYRLALWLRDHNLDETLAQSGLIEAIGAENLHYTYDCPMSYELRGRKGACPA
uniref:Sulfate permease, SulP family n=1 Tax=Candidatus Kentrum sp. TC TaxID=2126339 RepID=A0A450ZUD8_9GAMM|nr:MAG: sulfate permease, SulP family [Candidatus Kentron sp. TC]